jgi:hypothetical protein
MMRLPVASTAWPDVMVTGMSGSRSHSGAPVRSANIAEGRSRSYGSVTATTTHPTATMWSPIECPSGTGSVGPVVQRRLVGLKRRVSLDDTKTTSSPATTARADASRALVKGNDCHVPSIGSNAAPLSLGRLKVSKPPHTITSLPVHAMV